MNTSFTQGFARLSLAIIYIWFGVLKLTGDSPANPLVKTLQQKTVPFLTFEQFILALAIFEIIIGILFLILRFSKLAYILFGLHMISTFMPVLFVPKMVWQSMWVPTLEGQYIIKNLALISAVLLLAKKN